MQNFTKSFFFCADYSRNNSEENTLAIAGVSGGGEGEPWA